MQEDIYNHPLYLEAVEANRQRLAACTYTIAKVRDEIVDPVNVDRRADLLIDVENLVHEVMTLAFEVRELVWPESPTHPQTTGNE